MNAKHTELNTLFQAREKMLVVHEKSAPQKRTGKSRDLGYAELGAVSLPLKANPGPKLSLSPCPLAWKSISSLTDEIFGLKALTLTLSLTPTSDAHHPHTDHWGVSCAREGDPDPGISD